MTIAPTTEARCRERHRGEADKSPTRCQSAGGVATNSASASGGLDRRVASGVGATRRDEAASPARRDSRRISRVDPSPPRCRVVPGTGRTDRLRARSSAVPAAGPTDRVLVRFESVPESERVRVVRGRERRATRRSASARARSAAARQSPGRSLLEATTAPGTARKRLASPPELRRGRPRRE